MNQTWLGLMIIVIGTFIVQGLYYAVSPLYIAGYIIATIVVFFLIDYVASKIRRIVKR